MKKVLVVGAGGREHALAWKLAHSDKVETVYVAPGNGGTDRGKLQSIAIQVSDINKLITFSKENSIDLTVIGPDGALESGIVDDFRAAGLAVFGCSKDAAKIESSKAFAKELMHKNGIKTGTYMIFTDQNEAREHIGKVLLPVVVKASGLAQGKGVYICETEESIEIALQEIMGDKKFGKSGNEVVVEEFLTGTELSTHAFCDGKSSLLFPPSQDHKTIYENNMGPNTGGMGVVAPLPWADAAMMHKAKTDIVDPILEALKQSGTPFTGILYPGLMESDGQLSVIECNARFGDPEAQCYMRLLENDLYDILYACVTGTLDTVDVTWSNRFVACVVLASEGYPGPYEKGKLITGINEAETDKDVFVFHAGTKVFDGKLVSNGGRVLNVTATADTLRDAVEKAYTAVGKIDFEGKYFRADIGQTTLARQGQQ